MAGGTALATAGLAIAMVPGGVHATTPATTVQVSVTTGGFPAGAGSNGGSRHTERRLVSTDGRFVTFEAAGPVVPGQVQLGRQVVQRDRQLGTTTLVSQSSLAAMGDKASLDPSASADGRYVAFTSEATNLVAGDTNGQSDVFVRDTHTGVTTRVSVATGGAQIADSRSYGSGPASISADGRFVSFLSYAGGLAAGDAADVLQAYLHDRASGTTELVSLGADGLPRSAMTATSVSADGNRVLFMSLDADVAPGAANQDVDIFLRDRAAGTTRMVAGNQEGAWYPTISADGRVAAYQSKDPGIDPADTNNRYDIYVVDLDSLQHTLVSKSSAGVVGNAESRYPAMSDDGRYVVFQSTASDLVAGDTNKVDDIFRHDRQTGETIRVNLTNDGAENPVSASYSPAISADGQHVLFDSHGRTLTSVDTRTWGQVFVRDLGGRWPALHATIPALPAALNPGATAKVATRDIAAGQQLEVTWTPGPKTKGKATTTTVAVTGNAFVLTAPKTAGGYRLAVSYAGNEVAARDTVVRKPKAKKFAKKVKAGKPLKIKTVGLSKGDKVKVGFKPVGKTRGKALTRTAKVGKAGVVKVKAPKRGKYRVTVKAQGTVLRKGNVQVR